MRVPVQCRQLRLGLLARQTGDMPRKPRQPNRFTPRPNPAEPFRCAICTRQSRTTNVSLSSCQVQRDMCVEFITARGWLVIDEPYDDEGQSSETLDRPALSAC